MKLYVQFFNGDITVPNVDSTETKDGYFMALDSDGDKLFVSHEGNIKYVQFDYDA